MRTFKLMPEQKLKLLGSGYTLKEIESMVKADMRTLGLKLQTLKICFSEKEVSEWMQRRHPKKLSIDELYDWWVENAKEKYSKVSMSGLYCEYERLRAMGKPLRMYKEMAMDDKPHKVY